MQALCQRNRQTNWHACIHVQMIWEAGKAFLSPLKLGGQIELYNDFLFRKHANNTKSNKQKSKPIYRHMKGKYSFCHFSIRKMFIYWKWFYRFYSIQSYCSIQRIRHYSIGLSCTEARPFHVKNLTAPRYKFGSRQKKNLVYKYMYDVSGGCRILILQFSNNCMVAFR